MSVRGTIPEEVIQAAQVLMKWSEQRCAAVQAQEGPAAELFSMSSLAAPDGTLLVVCGPKHSHCLEHWFKQHEQRSHADTETYDDPAMREHGPSA